MQFIESKNVPKSKSPLSHGVKVGELFFVSGQICRNDSTVKKSVAEETRVVMENLGMILKDAGLTFGDVCKVNAYLTDLSKISEFNSVYKEYFDDHYPARCCIEVSRLAQNVQVEVELIATTRVGY